VLAGALAGTLLAGLAGVVAAADLSDAAGAHLDVSFSGFNRSYSEPGATMAPVVQGALTVRLSSPDNTLVVKSNRLRLDPLGDGTHRAEWTAEFLGQGKLIADFDFAGAPGRFEDEVVIPPQTRTVSGRIRLARGDGGYELTAVELPPSVEVAIHSQLAGRLVDFCEGMALLPLVSLDCGGLAAGLQTVAVPLPRPGETFLLPEAQLTAGERRQLDGYLARVGAPAGR
jgi:hypothetical protein